MEKPDAVSATPSRTEALRARGRRCETHIPRAPHSLASKTTIYRAGSRRTDGRHPLLRVLNFPPTLTFLSREDGRENCEERPLALAMGEGVTRPPTSCQGAAVCRAPPRPISVPRQGVLLTDPLGGGCSTAGRLRPAQTTTPLPPSPRLSALPPHSARRRPLAAIQYPQPYFLAFLAIKMRADPVSTPCTAPTACLSHCHLSSPAST